MTTYAAAARRPGATPPADSDRIEHHPAWMRAVGSVLFAGRSQVVTVPCSGDAPAALPLFEAPADAGSLARLGLPTHRHIALADAYLGPPDGRAQTLRWLLAEAHRRRPWTQLEFGRVPERSHLLAALAAAGIRHAVFAAGRSAFCDVRDPTALQKLSKEHLRNLDRLRRRAVRDYGSAAHEMDRSPAAFARFLAIERAGWKGDQGTGTAIALDSEGARFFEAVYSEMASADGARIDILRVGDQDAAAQLAVRQGRTWFVLKIGYDERFRDVGPGGLLLRDFLDEMVADRDIHEVNLSTDPQWARRWHLQSERCYNILIFNTTVFGQLRYWSRALRTVARDGRDCLWNLLRQKAQRTSSESTISTAKTVQAPRHLAGSAESR